MTGVLGKLPNKIVVHLKKITGTSGLPDTEESFELIAQNWLDKKAMFEAQIKLLNMEEVESLQSSDPRGALALTYSGSLLSLGPQQQGSRWLEYASIKLRNDVPNIVVVPKTDLSETAYVDKEARFTEGPVKSTSALLKIAVCGPEVSVAEQENRIHQATIFLTNGFVKINRQLNPGDSPDQFNLKGMANYLAVKNTLTQKAARKILDDFLALVETGLLLGETVSLGALGKIFLKTQAARKARVVKNPATGEEITASAKPEMSVPKIKFSRKLKEKAAPVLLNQASS